MSSLGWLRLPLLLTYAFLYIPIAVVVLMSFNSSKMPFTWTGFSLRWYGTLLEDTAVRQGFLNTMVVAVGATIIATVLKAGAQNAAKDPPSPAQRPVAPSGRG